MRDGPRAASTGERPALSAVDAASKMRRPQDGKEPLNGMMGRPQDAKGPLNGMMGRSSDRRRSGGSSATVELLRTRATQALRSTRHAPKAKICPPRREALRRQ
eukprot:4253084-Pyramimonas_sp.AAC.1